MNVVPGCSHGGACPQVCEVTAADAGPQRSGLGIAFLIGGIAVFSIQDVVVKELSPYYPVSQFVLLRTVFSIFPILALVVFEEGLANLRFSRPKLHILRGTLLFMAYATYFMAIASLLPMESVAAPVIATGFEFTESATFVSPGWRT